MAVAAVFTKKRRSLPQSGKGLLRHGQGAVGGEESSAFEGSRLSGARGELCRPCHICAVGCGAECPAERTHGSSYTRLEGLVRRSKAPGSRHGAAHPLIGEVVEQRMHDVGASTAQGRGPSGEVAHPETAVAHRSELFQRLRGEVDDGMDRLEQPPEVPGDGTPGRHRYPH